MSMLVTIITLGVVTYITVWGLALPFNQFKVLHTRSTDDILSDMVPPPGAVLCSVPDSGPPPEDVRTQRTLPYYLYSSLNYTLRSEFDGDGCTVYGHPSTGGLLIKRASVLDMIFLSLDRAHPSMRSSDPAEEDKFCTLLGRLGATLWENDMWRVAAMVEEIEMTEAEKRVRIYGWPEDGKGVWVLRYEDERKMPGDIGRLNMALRMDEKVEMMKEYGAEFYETAEDVEELSEELEAINKPEKNCA